ncbi:hypothetical protein [Leptospira sp. 'Mane']|uniref:hypothetical protein n=1 Tax=Leptospira sp. 'Mane' TaxID=3387407 RepID=UPI00398BB2CB
MKVRNFTTYLLTKNGYGLILLFLFFGLGCGLKIQNPCDPGSDTYNLTLITKVSLQSILEYSDYNLLQFEFGKLRRKN